MQYRSPLHPQRMELIQACAIPDQALLASYARPGGFTDCYTTELPFPVSHSEYVAAFYTTPLFKIERAILALLRLPSSDAGAARLAMGECEHFAAWRVEARTEQELLLTDLRGRTRSWLMVATFNQGARVHTRFYFGSAVVPVASRRGEPGLGWLFNALLGFHRCYSRLLLAAARRRLSRRPTP